MGYPPVMVAAEPDPASSQKPRPFYGLSPWSWAIYRSTWLIWWCVDRLVFRTRVKNLPPVDDGRPLLLLSNHVGMLDPFWVALHMWRPSRFMAATSVLRVPLLGPYLGALGAFPKMKYVRDRASMQTLADHYDAGHAITLFPEGVRSWTGRPMPILPGIGRLIQRLDARVLFGRIESGYLVAPRWARYPRWIPVEIDYSGPVRYPAHLSAEEITEDVRRRLHVEPRRDPARRAFGFRIAEGLDQLLWACPACGSLGGLAVSGRRRDTVRCAGCGAAWRLDLDAVLHGEAGAPTFTVAEAYDQMRGHFGSPPVLDPDRFARSAEAAQHPHALLHEIPQRGAPVAVAAGPLIVHADGVAMGGDRPWSAAWTALLAVSTELGDQIFLRVQDGTERGQLFRLDVPGQSSHMWGTVLSEWLSHDRSQRAANQENP